ncbi:MAG: type II secretion system GspH family protein [Planctomycetaceae bacterium]|nr:type II secretion system GspH family protein [Planctomycetaceae bacterium]
MRRRAITLIELLVVIAILAILVAILVPVFIGVIESSRRAKCTSNLKNIGKGVHESAADNGQAIPGFDSATTQWRRIGHYNNTPTSLNMDDGTRPLFMLMYIPSGATAKAVNYAAPAAFVCPSVTTAKPDPIGYSTQVGFTSPFNISYSVQHQIRVSVTGRLTLTGVPQRPICADKNPLMFYGGGTSTAGGTTFYGMDPTTAAHTANSVNHKSVGQNVLLLDASVSWRTTPVIPGGTDNMWDPRGQVSALVGSELPVDADDVFLVP